MPANEHYLIVPQVLLASHKLGMHTHSALFCRIVHRGRHWYEV